MSTSMRNFDSSNERNESVVHLASVKRDVFTDVTLCLTKESQVLIVVGT